MDDRYRGVKAGRRVVFVHPADLADLGFADGAMVDIVGEWHTAETSNAPTSKSVVVRLEAAAPA